ncbi:TonB-dependent receptor [Mucilaginibacter endophyticus]|uniref:TonB-dependent receptor n=1 Tax=Mucilaginibacter endophyticus TaxID=2675003 RepID=UPI000E0D3293|nr:carboxypeptidase-like regulatory domain-containing protein [Mucilaginibacter endophyticus]
MLFPLSANSQEKLRTIYGKVSDVEFKALSGATIKLKGKQIGAFTDSLGYFKVNTRFSGKHWLFCSSIGFRTDSVLVDIGKDSTRADFQLKTTNNDLSAVNIVLKRKIGEVPRTYTLNEYDIVTTAGAVGDVSAALQTFPGASPAGNETGLFIHGGTSQETQAFFDGMLVKNAFGSRLPDVANRSRFSAFLFERTTFTGSEGYGAEYGEALSSAFIMDTKGIPGASSTEFSLLSLGAGAAHTERFKNSSLMVGGNYYNFGLNNSVIPQNTLWREDPRQYQTSTHYKLRTKTGGMFKVYADYSDTRLAFDIRNPNKNSFDLLGNTNRNLYLNATYREYLGADWKLFAGVAYNRTLESGKVNADPYNQNDNAWHEKITLSRSFANNSLITVGGELFQNSRAEGYAGMSRSYSDVLSALFVSADVFVSKVLSVRSGIRGEYSAYLNKYNLSPRLDLIFFAGRKSSFTLNYASYYQKPDDSFLAQTAKLKYEESINYALLYELKIPHRNLKAEVFYKDYRNLTKITTPVFSGFQAYGPPVVIYDFNNQGSGYSRGFDLLWRDQSFAVGEYYVSYSYLDTKRNYIDYPVAGRPPFAPEHVLNIVGRKYITGSNIQVSGTYTFSSGRTYFNPLNPVFLSDKTRDFNNLSLGLSYIPPMKKNFAVFNITFANVPGFNQVYGYRYSYDGGRSEAILPPSKRGILISFLLNIGDGQFNH